MTAEPERSPASGVASQPSSPPPSPGAPVHPPRRWQRIAVQLVAAALVLGMVVLGWMLWQSRKEATAPAAAAAPPGPLEVSVVTVKRGSVPIRPHYLGRTHASQTVEIRARVSGFLEQRAFEEGRRVRQNDLLFRIDARPYQADAAVALARVEAAKARLEQARRQFERLQSALPGQAVSAAEIDQARTDVQVAEAELALAEAQYRRAELDLGYTEIYSPLEGLIGQALKDVGSYIEPAADSLLAVVQQVDPLYVEYAVSEQELLRWQELISTGQVRVPEIEEIPLQLELIDGSIFPHQGRINFLGVQVNPNTGTAIARGVFPNPENTQRPEMTLRPGQFVRVSALDIERVNVARIPQRAVLQSPAGASVWVVSADNTAEVRPVTLGEWVEDDWIVLKGLDDGDRVLVDRLMQVRPGMALRPVPYTPQPASSPPQPDQSPGAAPIQRGARGTSAGGEAPRDADAGTNGGRGGQ